MIQGRQATRYELRIIMIPGRLITRFGQRIIRITKIGR